MRKKMSDANLNYRGYDRRTESHHGHVFFELHVAAPLQRLAGSRYHSGCCSCLRLRQRGGGSAWQARSQRLLGAAGVIRGGLGGEPQRGAFAPLLALAAAGRHQNRPWRICAWGG